MGIVVTVTTKMIIIFLRNVITIKVNSKKTCGGNDFCIIYFKFIDLPSSYIEGFGSGCNGYVTTACSSCVDPTSGPVSEAPRYGLSYYVPNESSFDNENGKVNEHLYYFAWYFLFLFQKKISLLKQILNVNYLLMETLRNKIIAFFTNSFRVIFMDANVTFTI